MAAMTRAPLGGTTDNDSASRSVVRLNMFDGGVPSWDYLGSMPPDRYPAFGRTLRTALAMRGGVSLAVWIGGAVAELDLVRRVRLVRQPNGPVEGYLAFTRPADAEMDELELTFRRADIYARMLASRSIDSVDFDVLAGASAGGLNGVLYAAAQRAGAPVDDVVGIWRNAGDIWNLLQPPGWDRVDSALQGDNYFWPEVRQALERLYESDQRNEGHIARRVTLDLSATVTDGDDQADGSTKDGYGHFHFVGAEPTSNTANDPTEGRAIPRADSAQRNADLARLAYAARSTSSFPGAFEPALVYSHEADAPSQLPTDRVDLSYAFGAQRPEGGSAFRVADGGVKDNIPIDRAFRTIRSTPIDDFSVRALIYLNPAPDPAELATPPTAVQLPPKVQPNETPRAGRGGDPPRHDPLSYFVDATIAAVRKFEFRESGNEEIDSVEGYRRSILLGRGRTVMAGQPMRAATEKFSKKRRQAAIDDYVLHRASVDIVLLDEILQQPALWQLGTNLQSRRVRTAASPELRALVEQQLINLYQGGLESAGATQREITEGPYALTEAVAAGSAWLRFLEEAQFFVSPAELEQPRYLREEIRSLLADLSSNARTAREAQIDLVLQRVPVSTTAVAPDVPNADLIKAAEEIVAMWVTPTADLTDSWALMGLAVQWLKILSSELAKPERIQLNIDHSIWSKIPLADTFEALDLAPLVSGSGIPEPMSDLRFRTISAGEPPSAEIPFNGLRDQREVLRARRAMRNAKLDWHNWKRGDPLEARDRLAGFGLFSFGGFLAADWRDNDWWWGRLDGAAGLLRLLADQEAPPSPSHSINTASAVTAVQVDILRAATGDSTSTNEDLADAFAPKSPKLADLRRDYLSAVAARLLRVVSRAATRTNKGHALGRRLTIWLLRPILVIGPAALNAAKGGLLAAALLATITLLDPGSISSARLDTQAFFVWPGAVAAIAMGGALLIAAIAALTAGAAGRKRWSELDASDLLHRHRTAANCRYAIGMVIGLLALGGLAAIVHPTMQLRNLLSPLEFWTLVGAALIAFIAAARYARSLPDPYVARASNVVPPILGISLVGAAVLLSRNCGWPIAAPVTAGIGGAALAAILLYGWTAGLAPKHVAGRGFWSTLGRGAGAFFLWVALSLVSGATIAVTVWSTSLLPPSGFSTTVGVLAAVFVWGTTVWWVGEIPSPYQPSDAPQERS